VNERLLLPDTKLEQRKRYSIYTGSFAETGSFRGIAFRRYRSEAQKRKLQTVLQESREKLIEDLIKRDGCLRLVCDKCAKHFNRLTAVGVPDSTLEEYIVRQLDRVKTRTWGAREEEWDVCRGMWVKAMKKEVIKERAS